MGVTRHYLTADVSRVNHRAAPRFVLVTDRGWSAATHRCEPWYGRSPRARHEIDRHREPGPAAFTGLVLQETYTLGACIGRGGMGEVYEATHARLPGRMAVKILQPHLRTNEDAFARFCREAEIMSTCSTPTSSRSSTSTPHRRSTACPTSSWSTSTASIWSAASPTSGPLSLAATLRIVDAVASALGAAHAAGVVHRDLKPANIFLMRGEGPDADFVKVIDFGISKSRAVGPPAFQRGGGRRNARVHGPRASAGSVRTIDARTDQFALAAITYAMLAGRQPFVGNDAVTLLYQVIHQPHPPLSQFVSWDTTAIQPVLDRPSASGGKIASRASWNSPERSAPRRACRPTVASHQRSNPRLSARAPR